jgi:hypothetical protein
MAADREDSIVYFWKIKKLREHLILNGLSQRALFVYVFIYVLLCEAFLEFSFLFPAEAAAGSADWIWASINTLVIAFGTWLCYYFNGGNRGREFAERYFSISLVVGLRVFTLLFPAIMLCFAIYLFLGGGAESDAAGEYSDRWIDVAVLFWMALYYWRVIMHIDVVARERKS